jgi:hypothetical protein
LGFYAVSVIGYKPLFQRGHAVAHHSWEGASVVADVGSSVHEVGKISGKMTIVNLKKKNCFSACIQIRGNPVSDW